MTYSEQLQWSAPHGGPISVRVPVEDESRIGEARRAADAIAAQLGLSEEVRGVLAVVVSEAATNLARHALGGAAYFRAVSRRGVPGVEVLTIDHGPGMSDVSRSEVDGFSTGGTSGHGLGAMRRMASEFDLYSLHGSGTVVVARVFARSIETNDVDAADIASVGVVCRPLASEQVCGDGWRVASTPGRTVVLVVDGLGHGPSAAAAADLASEIFPRVADGHSPREILGSVHEALRATRGAAVAVAEICRNGSDAMVTLAGVGNITASIVGPSGSKALPSVNGTAGLNLRNAREFSAEWRAPARLVLATDGLTTRWRLDAYPGIFNHDPAVAAALLYRDHARARDDVTVLTVALRGTA